MLGELLTDREREVMALAGQGLSNDDIWAELFLSPATARTQGVWASNAHSENGWAFRLIDPKSRRSLRDLWSEYLEELDVDAEDEDEAPDAAED